MAKSQWLLARAQRLQSVAYDLLAGIENEADPDTAIVQAIRASKPDIIGRLERYAAAAERSFYKACREIAKQNETSLKRNLEAEWMQSAQAAGRGLHRGGNSADLAAPRESVVRELL